MPYELSSHAEQYLARIVADGLYCSKEAALEAAVVALQERSKPLPTVPNEHMELVADAVAAADAGQLRELTTGDWSRLRKLAHDVAQQNAAGGR